MQATICDRCRTLLPNEDSMIAVEARHLFPDIEGPYEDHGRWELCAPCFALVEKLLAPHIPDTSRGPGY